MYDVVVSLGRTCSQRGVSTVVVSWRGPNVHASAALAIFKALISCASTLALLVFACTINTVKAQVVALNEADFEVASVKPCNIEYKADIPSPGFMHLGCQTVLELIRSAYVFYEDGHFHPGSVDRVPIEGGPTWINSRRFIVDAKASTPQGPEMMRGPMMQTLLRERFKLSVHRVSRSQQGYSLTVAKNGPKLQPQREGNCVDPKVMPRPVLSPGQGFCGPFPHRSAASNLAMEILGFSLDDFSGWLSGTLGQPVINRTEITGKFDIHFDFAPDDATPVLLQRFRGNNQNEVSVTTSPDSADTGTSIFTALSQQLGLQLQRASVPGEVLLIDHVEMPSEN
jgi:uncharacterized protein (TIGR03435 family)